MTKFMLMAVVLFIAVVSVGCSDMPTTSITLEAGCVPEAGVRTCVVLPTQAAPVQVKVVAPVQVKVEPTVAPLPKAVGETFDLAAITVRCGQLAGNDVTKVASCVKCFQSGGTDWYKTDNECYVPKK
jgi:hypothetical protein